MWVTSGGNSPLCAQRPRHAGALGDARAATCPRSSRPSTTVARHLVPPSAAPRVIGSPPASSVESVRAKSALIASSRTRRPTSGKPQLACGRSARDRDLGADHGVAARRRRPAQSPASTMGPPPIAREVGQRKMIAARVEGQRLVQARQQLGDLRQHHRDQRAHHDAGRIRNIMSGIDEDRARPCCAGAPGSPDSPRAAPAPVSSAPPASPARTMLTYSSGNEVRWRRARRRARRPR